MGQESPREKLELERQWFETRKWWVGEILREYLRRLGGSVEQPDDLEINFDLFLRGAIIWAAQQHFPAEWARALDLLRSGATLVEIVRRLMGLHTPVSVGLTALQVIVRDSLLGDVDSDAAIGTQIARRDQEAQQVGCPAFLWLVVVQNGEVTDVLVVRRDDLGIKDCRLVKVIVPSSLRH